MQIESDVITRGKSESAISRVDAKKSIHPLNGNKQNFYITRCHFDNWV